MSLVIMPIVAGYRRLKPSHNECYSRIVIIEFVSYHHLSNTILYCSVRPRALRYTDEPSFKRWPTKYRQDSKGKEGRQG
jgi:hypothetical protein